MRRVAYLVVRHGVRHLGLPVCIVGTGRARVPGSFSRGERKLELFTASDGSIEGDAEEVKPVRKRTGKLINQLPKE